MINRTFQTCDAYEEAIKQNNLHTDGDESIGELKQLDAFETGAFSEISPTEILDVNCDTFEAEMFTEIDPTVHEKNCGPFETEIFNEVQEKNCDPFETEIFTEIAPAEMLDVSCDIFETDIFTENNEIAHLEL